MLATSGLQNGSNEKVSPEADHPIQTVNWGGGGFGLALLPEITPQGFILQDATPLPTRLEITLQYLLSPVPAYQYTWSHLLQKRRDKRATCRCTLSSAD